MKIRLVLFVGKSSNLNIAFLKNGTINQNKSISKILLKGVVTKSLWWYETWWHEWEEIGSEICRICCSLRLVMKSIPLLQEGIDATS